MGMSKRDWKIAIEIIVGTASTLFIIYGIIMYLIALSNQFKGIL